MYIVLVNWKVTIQLLVPLHALRDTLNNTGENKPSVYNKLSAHPRSGYCILLFANEKDNTRQAQKNNNNTKTTTKHGKQNTTFKIIHY